MDHSDDRRERPWLLIQHGQSSHLVTGILEDTEARLLGQCLAESCIQKTRTEKT